MNLILTPFEKSLPHHEMIFVEGGEFDMGGNDAEARDNEKPIHRVKISTFFLGKYPVTQALWKEVMGNNPSEFKGDDLPVEKVSWHDAKAFIQKLNEKADRNQKVGGFYRLPTEAEWEFAARGGLHSEGYLYAGSDKLKEVGWYEGNSGRKTQSVGQKYPNELGIFDMSGNVREWCEDGWHDNYKGVPADGSAWIGAGDRWSVRVYRGGCWFDLSRYCRVADRRSSSSGNRINALGFRLAMSAPPGVE